jgi:Tol biopolymer transport system component
MDLYRRPSNGVTPEELILATNADERPSDWAPDGKFILYWGDHPKGGLDLWILPLTGEPKPAPILQTSFTESNVRFSPDGRWISYRSDESGQNEVYVLPFPGPGPKWQVSVGGGSHPRWRRNGKEIYYRSLDDKIVSVEVNASDGKFEARNVRALFQGRFGSGGNDSYDVTADGQKFLIITASDGAATTTLTFVLNWEAELKKK